MVIDKAITIVAPEHRTTIENIVQTPLKKGFPRASSAPLMTQRTQQSSSLIQRLDPQSVNIPRFGNIRLFPIPRRYRLARSDYDSVVDIFHIIPKPLTTGDICFRSVRERNQQRMQTKYRPLRYSLLQHSFDSSVTDSNNVAPVLLPALLIRSYIHEYIQDAFNKWEGSERTIARGIEILAELRKRISQTVHRVRSNDNALQQHRAAKRIELQSKIEGTQDKNEDEIEALLCEMRLIDMFNIYISLEDTKRLKREKSESIRSSLIHLDELVRLPEATLDFIDTILHRAFNVKEKFQNPVESRVDRIVEHYNSLQTATELPYDNKLSIAEIQEGFRRLKDIDYHFENRALPDIDIRYAPDIFLEANHVFKSLEIDDRVVDMNSESSEDTSINALKALIHNEEPDIPWIQSNIYNDYHIVRNRHRHHHFKKALVALQLRILDACSNPECEEESIRERVYAQTSTSIVNRNIPGAIVKTFDKFKSIFNEDRTY